MKTKFFIFILFCIIISGCDDKNSINESNQNLNNSNTDTNVAQNIEQKSDFLLKNSIGDDILVSVQEDRVNFSNVENKAVLLFFMTTWCKPCQAQIPYLNSILKNHKDELVIIGINLEEDKGLNEVKSFIDYNQVTFAITYGLPNFQLAKEIGGVNNIPLMILYGKNGEKATYYIGNITQEMMEIDIKKVL